MKLQDQNPYDSYILGMANLYYPIGIKSFFINSPFVETNFGIVVTGKTYVLVHANSESALTLKIVNLIDVYYDNFVLNIHVRDLLNCQRINLEFDIHQRDNECSFKLVEADFLQKKIDFLNDLSLQNNYMMKVGYPDREEYKILPPL